MSNQQRIQVSPGGGNDDASEGVDAASAGQMQIKTAGSDELLDEIDALLDSNAEEFVRSYVQKGGQ
ncbi:ubiquitin-like protein Pup [Corynebacterium aquatimens]|uniref:Prokaryotic ubiquitin-like protein Pup n=1 Tax=Corynebacterium aquatimens TaxID=1190508 RepID=A0A931E0W3_9CORY|nr:ubiquitin-like protein Pup [Corynebacterium aquatimens]MBG6121585.1 ubiquitin-like protein Pup [Corynebacterium aquatimens]WJY65875.1 Prokaryotic ubiquitin-like protein Pup [Corynebacterium aquatimens]